MSRLRANSSPELVPSPAPVVSDRPEDFGLEGVATSVKILLKLLNEHKDTSIKDNDERRMHMAAGMMSIVDDVKTRIQKSQSFGKKRVAELRRCNTDLRPRDPSREKKSNETVTDEKSRLRKELNASLAARKSLEIMCSSLGKEKEIMASEIAKKVREMNGMEEHLNDLRAQNEMLLAKVQACASEHKEKKSNGGETQRNAALQERNKVLSEQLLKSLDGYRSLKRRFKDAQEENAAMRKTMAEMGVEVATGVEKIRDFRRQIIEGEEQPVDIEEDILALEHMFESLEIKILKHRQQKGDCGKT